MASYCATCVHDSNGCTHSLRQRHREDTQKYSASIAADATASVTMRPSTCKTSEHSDGGGASSRLSSPKRTVTDISLDRQREDRNTHAFSASLRAKNCSVDGAGPRRTPSPSPNVFLPHHTESMPGNATQFLRTVPLPPQFSDVENLPCSNESPRRRGRSQQQHPTCAQCDGMRRYIDLLREGFSKLCVAVTDDILTIREETNAKMRAMESNLMNAVSDAVRQERRYQSLLRNDTQEERGLAANPNTALAQVDALSREFKTWQSQVGSEMRRLCSDVEQMRVSSNHKQPQVHHNDAAPSFASILRDVTKHFDETIDARIRAETSPLSLHVRALTTAQHQLAQTVAEEEGRRVEHALSQRILKLETQLAEVKARVKSQGEEQRESIYALCNTVPVAAPM